MKKVILSLAVIVIFTIYAVHLKEQPTLNSTEGVVQSAPVNPETPMATTPSIHRNSFEDDEEGFNQFLNSQTPSTPTPVTTAPNANAKVAYKDGTYTGSIADAFYGNVQVQVTISGGRLTDVQFLQYPNDRQTSIDINSQAMPYLKQEAIQVQSAQVAGVTGATATSQAFIQSLGDALKQAV